MSSKAKIERAVHGIRQAAHILGRFDGVEQVQKGLREDASHAFVNHQTDRAMALRAAADDLNGTLSVMRAELGVEGKDPDAAMRDAWVTIYAEVDELARRGNADLFGAIAFLGGFFSCGGDANDEQVERATRMLATDEGLSIEEARFFVDRYIAGRRKLQVKAKDGEGND